MAVLPLAIEGIPSQSYTEWYYGDTTSLYVKVSTPQDCGVCLQPTTWVLATPTKSAAKYAFHLCERHLPPRNNISLESVQNVFHAGTDLFGLVQHEVLCCEIAPESRSFLTDPTHCRSKTTIVRAQGLYTDTGLWYPGVCSNHLPFPSHLQLRNARLDLQKIHQHLSE